MHDVPRMNEEAPQVEANTERERANKLKNKANKRIIVADEIAQQRSCTAAEHGV